MATGARLFAQPSPHSGGGGFRVSAAAALPVMGARVCVCVFACVLFVFLLSVFYCLLFWATLRVRRRVCTLGAIRQHWASPSADRRANHPLPHQFWWHGRCGHYYLPTSRHHACVWAVSTSNDTYGNSCISLLKACENRSSHNNPL